MAIRVETYERVRVIAIDRSHARNAVDPETATELFEAFLAFDADESVDVAVFSSSEASFCAGFDLKFAAEGIDPGWFEALDIPAGWDDPAGEPLMGPMGPTRLDLSKPVIAAISGPAVAGGMELAAWCDMRVMEETAFTGVFCRRWGVPLIDGGTQRLPRLIGESRAMDLILTGRRVEADEALALGFTNRVVPEGQSFAAALELAQDLCRFPQATMRADRHAARLGGAELAQALKREWQSAETFAAVGIGGAARFASGKGRGGDFGEI